MRLNFGYPTLFRGIVTNAGEVVDVPRVVYAWTGRVSLPPIIASGNSREEGAKVDFRCSYFQFAEFDDDGDPPWAKDVKHSTGNASPNAEIPKEQTN